MQNGKKHQPQADKKTVKPSSGGRSEASPPARPRKIVLTKVSHVRAELGRLYGEARRREIDVTAASKLANLLGILHRVIASSDLEERLETIEQRLKKEETPS
ncbi:hypothetical protein [Geobacter sulfurreducens]|uniref:hypothetical protein n=1 Tax=Geobacter sulfurreducens TaxID=35554 RepID=UPI000DBB2AF6|nr:hypothetical protein [Geobacter sulfurreducens]BBA71736.1 hypothetical protein YM18_3228 [Geobacter sulfurreducens]